MNKPISRWKRLKAVLASAFIIEEESEWHPTDRQQEIVEKLVRWVVRRRLTLPAIMSLESITPMNFLSSQALVFFQPFISAFLDTAAYQEFQEMLEHRPSIQYMIQVLESREEAFTARQKADKKARKKGEFREDKE